jgi:hypothetical protein
VTLDGVGYYVRLSVVDDASIPFIYAALGIALAGLSVALLVRQRALVAVVVEKGGGSLVEVGMRDWRNGNLRADEIRSRLSVALAEEDTEAARGD